MFDIKVYSHLNVSPHHVWAHRTSPELSESVNLLPYDPDSTPKCNSYEVPSDPSVDRPNNMFQSKLSLRK